MSVSMYTVSVPVFIQHLNGLNTVLDKAATWAAARKVNDTDLLNMRLSPDMFNLARQVRAATDHAANAAGRLAGKELLKFANDETTIAQLKDRIAKAIDYLKNIKQSEIDGTESKEIIITFPSGQTRQFTGQGLQQPAKLLLSRYYSLRHYPAVRRRDRQARLHGHTADIIGTANFDHNALRVPPTAGMMRRSLITGGRPRCNTRVVSWRICNGIV
jgi:uncharacterized protein